MGFLFGLMLGQSIAGLGRLGRKNREQRQRDRDMESFIARWLVKHRTEAMRSSARDILNSMSPGYRGDLRKFPGIEDMIRKKHALLLAGSLVAPPTDLQMLILLILFALGVYIIVCILELDMTHWTGWLAVVVACFVAIKGSSLVPACE